MQRLAGPDGSLGAGVQGPRAQTPLAAAALQGNRFLGRRGARATHGVNSFLTPAPGLTGPEGPTSQRLPRGDSVAPSLSPDTAVDGPQAIDLERSAPFGLRIVTNIRVRRDAGRELRVNRTLWVPGRPPLSEPSTGGAFLAPPRADLPVTPRHPHVWSGPHGRGGVQGLRVPPPGSSILESVRAQPSLDRFPV